MQLLPAEDEERCCLVGWKDTSNNNVVSRFKGSSHLGVPSPFPDKAIKPMSILGSDNRSKR